MDWTWWQVLIVVAAIWTMGIFTWAIVYGMVKETRKTDEQRTGAIFQGFSGDKDSL